MRGRFESALEAAGDSLVIVDYATSWCGPCKVIAPKYEAMSEEFTDVKFFKVRWTLILIEDSQI